MRESKTEHGMWALVQKRERRTEITVNRGYRLVKSQEEWLEK